MRDFMYCSRLSGQEAPQYTRSYRRTSGGIHKQLPEEKIHAIILSVARLSQGADTHDIHIYVGENGAIDTFLLFSSLWNDIHVLIDRELLFPMIKIFYKIILREQINTKSFTKNYVEFCFELSNFLNTDNIYTKEQHLPWTNCGSQKLKASMAGEFFLNSSSLSKLYLSTSAWSSTPWFTPYGPREI